jgi:hypothetical protein
MQLSPAGVPPLPYTAPFTCSVPEVLELCRQFVVDSLAFLRGLYSPWELLTAVFHQRDRMLSKARVGSQHHWWTTLVDPGSPLGSAEQMPIAA